jgi:hypothetical protein
VAIVGSSMAFRLYEPYFRTPLRNLSIGGGSPLTGLAIMGSYKTLPKLILVETNIMSRPIDAALVEQFGDNPSELYAWFKPARALISLAYYWLKDGPENTERLLRLPPAEYDISRSISDSAAEYAQDWTERMKPNVEHLERLVEGLRQRGCKIVFFEMPSPPGISESRFTRTARRLTHAAFPEGWIEIPGDEQLRWVDASHLDERSAIRVAKGIDRFLSE